MNETITPQLDRFQAKLPPVARRVFKLNRRIATAGVNAAVGATKAVCFATKNTNRATTPAAADAASEAEPATDDSYVDLTKAELYDRAQTLDIEGRSTMNKNELISALRAA